MLVYGECILMGRVHQRCGAVARQRASTINVVPSARPTKRFIVNSELDTDIHVLRRYFGRCWWESATT